MLKRILLGILAALVVPASFAFPWGAVTFYSPTHQAIDEHAYALLQQDPAFQGSFFQLLPSILAHEGVVADLSMTFNPIGRGPGPDSEGATPYSWHYFNPLTGEGNGPGAVSQFYFNLLNINSREKAKGAAWAAHFLADMSVPYHIVGTTRDNAFRFVQNGTMSLAENITGPAFLYDNSMQFGLPEEGWGLNGNFREATKNYVTNHSSGAADWYDPWYSNGYRAVDRVATSSHVVWEKGAHGIYEKSPFYHPMVFIAEDGRYNPSWRNATPDYSFSGHPAVAQAAQASQFAADAALFTRNHIKNYYMYPGIGVDHAIRNVATLWRASFSGLRPQMLAEKDVPGYSNYDPNRYYLVCRITNVADDTVRNVKAKMFISGGGMKGSDIRALDSNMIMPGCEASILFDALLKPETEYTVYMEVRGEYNIPDLQYAAVMGTFRTQKRDDTDPPPPPPTPPDPFKNILGSWEFGRNKTDHIGTVILTKEKGKHGYLIKGYSHPNETYWDFYGENSIVFKHRDGQTTTYFLRLGPNYWEGRFLPPKDWPNMKNAVIHYLKR